jgi:hypothetical protein
MSMKERLQKWQTPLLVLFGIYLFVHTAVILQVTFTSQVPGANDFYPRWRGSQVFWQDGIDPYSREATEAIQRDMYGRLALPEEDQVLFVYPFYTVFLLFPLVWLPYSWVQAIWLTIVLYSLVGGVLLTLQMLRWRLTPFWFGLVLIWTVFCYHSVRTIILGQFAGPVFLTMILALWFLQREKDGWAGLMLALTTFKPQMSFLFIPLLLLWALRRRRWRFIGSAAAAMAVLTGISFLFSPGWLSAMFTQVRAYPGYTEMGAPIWILTHVTFPQLGRPVQLVVNAILLLYTLWLWRDLHCHSLDAPRFWLILTATMLITNLVVTRTSTTNYVMLYAPLFWLLALLNHRPRGTVFSALILLGTLPLFWWAFLADRSGIQEGPLIYFILPLGLLAALFAVHLRWSHLIAAAEGR